VEKRPRGRPRKKEGSIEPWQLGRAAIVMSAYDESREKGAKHSVAIREAVDTLRHRSPKMRISETEVKRILSTFRPKGSRAILRFERSPLSEEDVNRHRRMWEEVALSQVAQGISSPQGPGYNERRRCEKFTIRFSERPEYPRHNRKTPKE
jgi:hypothetical protein